MRHASIVVLNGFSRGGSNLLWNVLQSHPGLCSPILETGEILWREVFPAAPRLARRALSHPLGFRGPLGRALLERVDRALYRRKLQNLGHPENGTRSEGVAYREEEVRRAVPMLKSLDADVELFPALSAFYPRCHGIGLVRDGLAVCNGRVRRGARASDTGEAYRRTALRLLEYEQRFDHFCLVRFEEVLADPFGVAERLFRFVGLSPTRLPKLRLKAKPVLRGDGSSEPVRGSAGRKYWLDEREIRDFLAGDIDSRQVGELGDADRDAFTRAAGPALERLGYPAPACSRSGTTTPTS